MVRSLYCSFQMAQNKQHGDKGGAGWRRALYWEGEFAGTAELGGGRGTSEALSPQCKSGSAWYC